MDGDIYLEKSQEFFGTNKDNVYLFSIESLYATENPNVVQISFQRMLNENISKENFILAENRIIAYLEYLYINSEKVKCYSVTHIDGEQLKKHKCIKKTKEVKTFTDYVSRVVDNDEYVDVENINVLRGFAFIGTRYGLSYFYFENPDIEVIVDNCQSFYIKFKDINIAKKFIVVAHKLGINSDKLNYCN